MPSTMGTLAGLARVVKPCEPRSMADPNKPGIKTTEFILSTLAALFGALLTSGLFDDGSTALRICGVASIVLATVGYTWSRGAIKVANANAAAAGATSDATSPSTEVGRDATARKTEGGFVDARMLLAMLGLSLVLPAIFLIGSCGAVGKEARAVAAGIVDCTAKQTASTVRELRPLGDAMLVNAVDQGRVTWGPIRDLAKSFASDVSRCVLADAVSRALHPPPADPNAPKLSPLEVDREALRAGFGALSRDLYGGVGFKTDTGTI